ncbi:MAG: Crp/Fnr family transcriptional regulator [Clostridiales bacterium]|jgi:CRP/FNR family transcriptional regulator|nr:Crp/Fnr family transcriptional regulator [Clostridiales bacterium]
MQTEDKIELFKQTFSFWDKLSEDEKQIMLSSTVDKIYKTGENIYNDDESCVGALIVKSGQIRVFMLSTEGREITLFRLLQGELCVLSASCVLKNITFKVNIDVIEDAEVIILRSSEFSRLMDENVYVENFFSKIIADRFSKTMWVMEQVLFMKFDKRLALFLIDESENLGSDVINLTHEQIARYTSSAREVVSRMLKYFEKENIIKTSRGKIKIIDRNKLAEYAD